MKDIPQSVAEWLIDGERGCSSETIVRRLYGANRNRDHWEMPPKDPADLRRCILLLEACPEIKARFHEMLEVDSEWSALVHYWQSLDTMLRAEIGNLLPSCGWSAPKTYKAMKSIQRGGKP